VIDHQQVELDAPQAPPVDADDLERAGEELQEALRVRAEEALVRAESARQRATRALRRLEAARARQNKNS
jgi:hypothetical protein